MINKINDDIKSKKNNEYQNIPPVLKENDEKI